MCKISIIVPVYNVEKYLKNCIDSILNQTFKDFELILVNDGSTDQSPKICDLYKEKDLRIRVVHKENGGLSSARNVGIEKARGDYIGFVDSDDFIHPEMYEILYNNINQYKADIAMCNYKIFKENEKIEQVNCKNKVSNIRVYANMESLNNLEGSKGVIYVIAWNKLYNKNLFNKIRYPEGKIHEDEFVIQDLLYNINKLVYIPLELYYYLQRDDSITKSGFNISKLDYLDAFINRIEFYENINKMDLMYRTQLNYIRNFYDFYYKTKKEISNPQDYLKNMKKSYNRQILKLIKNKYISYKSKIIIILFYINPSIYEKIYIN